MKIMAFESTCDETAAAVVEDGRKVLSDVIASQADMHALYGGVVPEIASRKHVEAISGLADEALRQAGLSKREVDAVAVTYAPGLIGALLVGVSFAKSAAFGLGVPLIPVHHLAGHIYANELVTDLQFPLVALVVSGGNSELVYMKDENSFEILGQTQDDAIGEAYDKVARVMGLGYPGGPVIDKLAQQGKAVYDLPEPKTQGRYDFSFSGLKSGVLQFIKRCERKGQTFTQEDLAASFQKAALDEVFDRVKLVLEDHPEVKQFVVGGGVSANSGLRARVDELRQEYPDKTFTVPPMRCCTDNAAMIAVAGEIAAEQGRVADARLTADPGWEIC